MVSKSSKKGWRGIKLASELDVLQQNEIASELGSRVDSLFTDDPIGKNQGISKQVEKLVKLQNKKGKSPISISEELLLKKAIGKVSLGQKQPTKSHNRKLVDVWADSQPDSKVKNVVSSILRRESVAPSVVPPIPSLSVNPCKDIFETMILAEAKKEMEALDAAKLKAASRIQPAAKAENAEETAPVNPELATVQLTERKTKAQKLKEQKHRQMLKEHEQKRKEKEARKALMNKSALKAMEEEHAKRQEQRLSTKVRRIIDEASGKITLARGAGGRLIASKEEIPLEIASSMRRIVPVGDPILERRASFLRRRMIEQIPVLDAEYKEKLRFARLTSAKSRKIMDSDTKARCVLLG